MPKEMLLLGRAIALLLGYETGLIQLDAADLQLIETALKRKPEDEDTTVEEGDENREA